LTVIDRLSSRGAHEVAWFWHFAETVAVSLEPGRGIARVPGWRIEMAMPDGCAPSAVDGSGSPWGLDIAPFQKRTRRRWRARSSGDTSWATRIAVIQEAAV
jgi:hypothetical protein